MAINGRKIMLMKGGVVVAAVTSHDVKTEADRLEIASATQGQWREFIAGRKSWEITANYLVLSADTIQGIIQIGQTFLLKSYDRANATNYVQGNAVLEQCRIKATRGFIVEGYFKFRGTQGLTAHTSPGDFNNDYNEDFNNYI